MKIATYFMFKKTVAKVILSSKVLTSLTFNSPVLFHSGSWDKRKILSTTSQDSYSLYLKPLKEIKSENLYVVTRDGRYNFILDYNEKNPHYGIDVENGKKDYSFSHLYSDEKVSIFQGKHTLRVKSLKDIVINGVNVKKSNMTFIGKGFPVYVDGKRVLF